MRVQRASLARSGKHNANFRRNVARPARMTVVCAAPVPDANVVVIGGTGRVGSSTASALIKEFPNLKLTLASRSESSYKAAVDRRPELSKAAFQTVDITNPDSVKVRAAPDLTRCSSAFRTL